MALTKVIVSPVFILAVCFLIFNSALAQCPAEDELQNTKNQIVPRLSDSANKNVSFHRYASCFKHLRPSQLSHRQSHKMDFKNGIRGENFRWKGGKIPYVFHSSITSSDKTVILKGMEMITKKTCIRFVELKAPIGNYVQIQTSDNGCYSDGIGMLGGKQTLNIGGGCMFQDTVAHELIHVIGFWHQQTTFYRNRYIQVVWSNILSWACEQFRRRSPDQSTDFGQKYDYKSIMHYGTEDFALDESQPTMKSLDRSKTLPKTEDDNAMVTDIDAAKIKIMYQNQCK